MRVLHRFLRDDKGFTLIELMVVVLIIGILAAVAVPNFLNQTDKAKANRVKADLKNIGTAAEMYYLENGSLPAEENLIDDLVTEKYLARIPRDPDGDEYSLENLTAPPVKFYITYGDVDFYYPDK